jgi:diguanylate cyclase (GGDEF)-like protein
MSPITAANFVLTGLALLFLKAHQTRLAACTHRLVIPALFVSALAIVGYAYGVALPDQLRHYNAMALSTVLLFFILTLSILAADSGHGFAKIAASDTAGGLISRRLLPTLPLLLFGLGWLRLEGERAGLYGFEFGLALMILLSTTVCVIAVASTATSLHRIDLRRKQAEAQIMSLNVSLERRVQERTEELDVANKLLEQLALEDGLTHLANRRLFDRYLNAQIVLARRNRRTLSLVLCDVDLFKLYNDNHGHQAGDECLRQIAAAIRSCCRRPADLAARYGGEEFAIILPETELAGAVQIAEAAREAVKELRIPHLHSRVSTCISISGGVACVSGNRDSTAQQIIASADQALYRAKLLGRDRTVGAEREADWVVNARAIGA